MTKDSKKPKHTSHKPGKKVFDVMRPGKTPASATSRPVIPAQKPPVPDDQFVPGAPTLRASDPSTKHDLMDSKHKKALQPLSASVAFATADAPVEKAAHDVSPEPKAEAAAAPEATGAPALPRTEKPTPAATDAAEAAPAQPGPTAPVSGTVPPEPLIQAGPPVTGPPSPISAAVSGEGPATLKANGTPPLTEAAARATSSTPLAEEDTPAHLAMEQTVQAGPDVPIWEQPENSVQVESNARPAADRPASSKSIEDLLAETGAPTLEAEKTPSLIISHHQPRARAGKVFLVVVLILLLAVAALDLLLDAEIIKTGVDIPHTDFL